MPTELQQILADLAAAQGALRRSSAAFDLTMSSMHGVNDGLSVINNGFAAAIMAQRKALDGLQAANHAQGEAIDIVITATNKALALFNADEQH